MSGWHTECSSVWTRMVRLYVVYVLAIALVCLAARLASWASARSSRSLYSSTMYSTMYSTIYEQHGQVVMGGSSWPETWSGLTHTKRGSHSVVSFFSMHRPNA